MTLADRLGESPTARPTGTPCSMAVLLGRLDDGERTALDAMLYELRWSGAKIHSTLKAEGYEVGQQTVNRHRAKACRCFA